MEAPAPTYLITPELNKAENILVKKEYSLMLNNKPYLFTISHDNKYIYFIIKEQNNILFFQYKNEYDLQKIIQYLKLNVNFYNDLNKIIELLDKVFINKKMNISYNEKNDIFNINIKLQEYFQEYDSNIILKKKELENNEKFEIIIKEIKEIKNDIIIDQKLEIITKSLNDLKKLINKKLNENSDLIESLRNKITNNETILKTNEKEIQLLKDEISRLKEIISNKKVNKEEKKIKSQIINKKSKNKENIIKENKNIKINKKIEQSYFKNDLEEKKDIKVEKLDKDDYKDYYFPSFPSFQISILGSCCVGKSSIVQKYLSLPIDTLAHTHFKDYITYLKVNNTIINLRILDHPGQERFRLFGLKLSMNSDLIVFVYKDYNSFDDAKTLIKQVKEKCIKNIHYALIISLSESQNERQTLKEEGEKLAKNEGIDLFMEVSHYTGYNINNLFFEIVKILYMDKK